MSIIDAYELEELQRKAERTEAAEKNAAELRDQLMFARQQLEAALAGINGIYRAIRDEQARRLQAIARSVMEEEEDDIDPAAGNRR